MYFEGWDTNHWLTRDGGETYEHFSSDPTLLQSIFLQNDPLIDQRIQESGWLAEVSEQTTAGTQPTAEQLVEAAWLRTVSRPPTDAEKARALQHLAAAESMHDGLRDLLWARINTTQFILLH